MRISNIICLLVLISCLGCKKYPENKFLQRVNTKNSIKGSWAFKAFYVDGADSTHQQLALCNPVSLSPGNIVWLIEGTKDEYQYKSTFSHLYQKVNDIFCSCLKYYPLPGDISGVVSLVDKRNDLSIAYTHDGGYPIDYQDFFGKIYSSKALDDNDTHWQIKKLNKTDLALENVIGEKRYRLEFTRQ